MKINYPYCPFERYADDTVIHCKSEAQAKFILDKVRSRMEACKLESHPVKTKIVYCQDKDRQKQYECAQFDFLTSVSKSATKSLNVSIRAMEIHKQTGAKIEMVAEMINPIVRGWMNYFGRYNRSAMKKGFDCVQRRLICWAMCIFKHFREHRQRAEWWLNEIKKREPEMFAHWALSNVKC